MISDQTFEASKYDELIDDYISYVERVGIDKHIQSEGYKFEDLTIFHGNFDLEAHDLRSMIEKSIASDNLSITGNYYPRLMLLDYAEFDAEETRKALRQLFNEANTIEERINSYTAIINSIHERRDSSLNQQNNTYQDARFISLLLSFKQPKEFAYYKNKELISAISFITEDKTSIGGDNVYKIEIARSFCKRIQSALENNPRSRPIINAFAKLYPDITGNLWLAQDVYFNFSRLTNPAEDTLDLLKLVQEFIRDANGGSLKSKKYSLKFQGFDINASFGQGSLAQVPWIGFRLPGHTNAINLLYFKRENKLVLAYGVPEEKTPTISWKLENQTITDHYANEFIPLRYGSSLFINEYSPENLPESILADIDNALDVYRKHAADSIMIRSKFWIFQGNPDVFDIEEYLSSHVGQVVDWSANQLSDQMNVDDVVYFWSAKDGGLCGIGTIVGTPEDRSQTEPEEQFGNKKVGVKLLKYFEPHNRIKRSDLISNDELSHARIIKQPQASNFLLTEKEAFELQKLIAKKLITQVWVFTPGPKNEFLSDAKVNNRIRIGWDRLGDLRSYVDRESIKNALQQHYDDRGSNQYNNTTACDEFLSKMQAGDIVILKSGLTGISAIGHVTGDYGYDASLEKYKSIRPALFSCFGEWQYDPKAEPVFTDAAKNLPIKTMTDMSPYPELIERIINCMPLNGSNPMENKPMPTTNLSLNTILYGPPGTGKTYQAIYGFAHNLLSEQADQTKTTEEVLADRLKDLTWWQVTALSLYQIDRPVKVAALAQHQLVISYATYVKNRNTNIKPTLWAVLQERSDVDSSNTTYRVDGVEYFTKNDQSEWSLTESGTSLVEETLSDIDLVADAELGTDWHKYLRTITFHQSYSYEEFIEGIRPVLNPAEQNGAIGFEIKDGVFKEMCSIARRDPSNRYLLIIDEINRGNISKVFGELITLLEDDKREVLTVQLPYSKEEFTVPKNLYVLGTMNTADRSIALLDIALRRRFNFIEIMPDYSLIEKNIDGIDLATLLKTVNQKLEIMTDRDHQIGHSYFMNVDDLQDLHSVWYNKVLPLLSEYFYNDWDRLIEVVGVYHADKGTGFIHKKSLKEIQHLFGKETEYSEAVVGSIKNYSPQELPQALKAVYEAEPQTD